MFPMPPPSALVGNQKNIKISFFSLFFINISLKPVLRIGVIMQRNAFDTKKGLSWHAEYFLHVV